MKEKEQKPGDQVRKQKYEKPALILLSDMMGSGGKSATADGEDTISDVRVAPS